MYYVSRRLFVVISFPAFVLVFVSQTVIVECYKNNRTRFIGLNNLTNMKILLKMQVRFKLCKIIVWMCLVPGLHSEDECVVCLECWRCSERVAVARASLEPENQISDAHSATHMHSLTSLLYRAAARAPHCMCRIG